MRLGLMVVTNHSPRKIKGRGKDDSGGIFLTTKNRLVFEVPSERWGEEPTFYNMNGNLIKLDDDERLYPAYFSGGSTGIVPVINESEITHREDGIDEHKAFGVVSVVRSNHYPKQMFGSKIRHYNSVDFTVKRAQREKRRDGTYYYFGREKICEFSLTPAQFGDLISSFGIADGTPCCIEYTMEDGYIPFPTDHVNEIRDFSKFEEAVKDDISRIKKDTEELKELFANKGTMKVADKQRVLNHLGNIITLLGSNADSYIETFNELLEETKSDFVSEIEAEARNRTIKYGIKMNMHPEKLLQIGDNNELQTEMQD